VAFVLSGGGNLGAIQVGMARALLERGIKPDLIVGCSVGAINGAALADDPSLVGVARLEEVWRQVDGNDLMPRSILPNAVAMARKGEAIHDNDGLRQMLTSAMGARTFADLTVHFECVATDIEAVREVWFSEGPLVEPILASAAMPALYPAVEIGGVRYLDGAIVNDVPLSRAVELGATTLYVLQVGSFSRPREKPRRPLDVAVSAYWIARHHRYKRDLDNLPEDVELHLLPHGQPPLMRYNDFTRTPELIGTAYEASSAYLQALTTPAAAAARRAKTPAPAAPAATAASSGSSGQGDDDDGSDSDSDPASPPPPPSEPSDNVLA
jgi:NTE family protein